MKDRTTDRRDANRPEELKLNAVFSCFMNAQLSLDGNCRILAGNLPGASIYYSIYCNDLGRVASALIRLKVPVFTRRWIMAELTARPRSQFRLMISL